jgi:hypothetical protein
VQVGQRPCVSQFRRPGLLQCMLFPMGPWHTAATAASLALPTLAARAAGTLGVAHTCQQLRSTVLCSALPNACEDALPLSCQNPCAGCLQAVAIGDTCAGAACVCQQSFHPQSALCLQCTLRAVGSCSACLQPPLSHTCRRGLSAPAAAQHVGASHSTLTRSSHQQVALSCLPRLCPVQL